MKKFLFLCLVITGGIMLPSCESDDAPQPFIPDSVRLNPEDSIIMMDLYRDMPLCSVILICENILVKSSLVELK